MLDLLIELAVALASSSGGSAVTPDGGNGTIKVGSN